MCALSVYEGALLFVAKGDLSAFYRQLHTPQWMWDYISLPPVQAVEVGLEAV